MEGVFGGAISAAVFAVVVLEEASAHHGRGGEGNQKGNSDSHAENDGEFAEQAANDATHHQDRDEDGDKRGAHGEDSETDFAGALHGGGEGLHAVFHVPSNVFNHDDGVVNDETRRNGERHEREIVDAV